MSAVSLAYDKAAAVQRRAQIEKRKARERVVSIVLPREVLGHGLARRQLKTAPASGLPENVRPVTFLVPLEETASSIHEFVLSQFTTSAQRLARADHREK